MTRITESRISRNLFSALVALAAACLLGTVATADERGEAPTTDETAALRVLEAAPFGPSIDEWSQIASQTDASSATGLLARGVLALERGDVDAARQAIEAARRANGGSPYPYYYLARIELEEGNPWGAIGHLRASVLRRRDFAGAYQLLGRAYLELGSDQKGLSALRTAIALAPGRADSHLELGRAYLENGHPAHAVVELSRAHELNATSLDTLYLLAKAKLNSGQVQEGFADLETYVQVAEADPAEQERVERARMLLLRFAGGSRL